MLVESFLDVWFTEKMNLLFWADVGDFGFMTDNNVDSNLEAWWGYEVRENIRIEAGYRGRYDAFGKGSGSEGIKSHGWYHGWVLGAVFSF
jgi:hypothetical protein